eukprot:6475646-Amphidinium_carterae.1
MLYQSIWNERSVSPRATRCPANRPNRTLHATLDRRGVNSGDSIIAFLEALSRKDNALDGSNTGSTQRTRRPNSADSAPMDTLGIVELSTKLLKCPRALPPLAEFATPALC